MQILETKEVKKYYPTPSGIVRALDGVSLSVKEGTFGAIVGSSGSGKTTLLHMLGGLDEPTDGQIWVRGTALKGMSGEEKTVFRRRNIGFVFQNYNLVSTLSVRENIMLPLLLDGMRVDQKFLKEITESLKMTEKLDHMPHMLSGWPATAGCDRAGTDHEAGGDSGRCKLNPMCLLYIACTQ